MRLATINVFDAGITDLQSRQERLQQAQQRLTSGKRVERASDDPTGAARAERALATMGRVDANQRALEASRNGMTLIEGALGDANELLQQIRETMAAAGNATYSDSERNSLANKIEGLRGQMLAIANRADGSGGYLFSGQGSGNPPFLDTAAGVVYSGSAGQIQTGNLDNFPLTVDGRMTWEQARSGNGSFVTSDLPNSLTGAPATSWIDAGRVTDPAAMTGDTYKISIAGSGAGATYTVTDVTTGGVVKSGTFASGKSIDFDGMSMTLSGAATDGDEFQVQPAASTLRIFDVLDSAVADLRQTNRTGTEIVQSNVLSIRDLDASIANLQNVRSQVGERLNNLDGTENRLAALKQYNEAEKSAAEDLDMTRAISDFQNQQTGYEAALKAYATVQRMSLFDYLRN